MTDKGLGDIRLDDEDVERTSLVAGARQPEATTVSWSDRYAGGHATDAERRAMWRDFDNSWVMVAELVAATLTWGGIGWLLDNWLGLSPILMSLGFIIGSATGFYLVWGRSTGQIGRIGETPAAEPPTVDPAGDTANRQVA